MKSDKVLSSAVLIVDDDPAALELLRRSLEPRCALVEAADSIESAEALRERYRFDLLIVATHLRGLAGVEWLRQLRARGDHVNVVLTAHRANFEAAVAALRAGATDFLPRPFRTEQMMATVARCLEQRRVRRDATGSTDEPLPITGLIGNSSVMREVCDIVRRTAATQLPVLVEGETGTGKSPVARAIHELGGRPGALVTVNCGSLTPDTMERELFGQVGAAGGGPGAAHDGAFSQARDGTLLLDEVSEMPAAMQVRLVRVLEQQLIRPVGSRQEIAVNPRIVATTHRQLGDEAAAGRFRADLYFRLNVVNIALPPLRLRRDDIPDLARYFSGTMATHMNVPPVPLEHDDIVRLQTYSWPGNVRELKNVIERSLLLSRLPDDCCAELAGVEEGQGVAGDVELPVNWSLADVEKHHIYRVLDALGGNKSQAAQRLGVSRKTLDRKLRLWGA